ncbi:Ent-copalyl diphosphate synthase [Vigna angularis]|uniref:Ent-copalyl diphosphate synthase n=1 Tax=Phaseolus angularis TaxID=3914 RepID=A0A8T0KZI4_PHAAN|nr:Ent-copalyl diphosphate synthase [Vigna angularis]
MASHFSFTLSHTIPASRARPAAKSFHSLSFYLRSSYGIFKEIVTEVSRDNISKDDNVDVEVPNQEIQKKIKMVKLILDSKEDGEITISAYDTAWVGLVKNVGDTNSPQFPSCLEWIANNQLHDGSWGDAELFIAHDRILNTLACVVALRSWNMHPQKCEKGMQFFKENLYKLQDENPEHMPIGFEVTFPSLLDLARCLDVEVPDDSPILKNILAMRDLKLKNLEGMQNLDWKQLLKLQCQDGSFLFSPSSTAYALIQTKNESAHKYLDKTLQKFNGGVPNVYPVDLFEHTWIFDRLDRLGISRYFQSEIKDCVTYVSRNSEVQDIDDTAMGFRLLRLHGHQVSSSVFEHFKKNGEFFCFSGQSNQAVTGMFNLYRASQLLFQGEEILEDAKNFSTKFLTEKREANQLLDKWIITKDLPGEVSYALDVPWYASLPRMETRFYLEQYGGSSDVWIGKTLYRMPFVNNDVYLELAKLDYSICQAVHCVEWEKIQRKLNKKKKKEEELLEILLTNLDYLGFEMLRSHGRELSHYLNQAGWLSSWQNEGNSLEREAELIVQIINVMAGYWSEELRLNPQYQRLLQTTNRVCHGLRNYQISKAHDSGSNKRITCMTTHQIESDMRELVQLVLQNSSDGVHTNVKNSFLTVAKGFYYGAYCDPETINSHIQKVLFEKVM